VSFEPGLKKITNISDINWQSVPELRASNRKASITFLLKTGLWDLEDLRDLGATCG